MNALLESLATGFSGDAERRGALDAALRGARLARRVQLAAAGFAARARRGTQEHPFALECGKPERCPFEAGAGDLRCRRHFQQLPVVGLCRAREPQVHDRRADDRRERIGTLYKQTSAFEAKRAGAPKRAISDPVKKLGPYIATMCH